VKGEFGWVREEAMILATAFSVAGPTTYSGNASSESCNGYAGSVYSRPVDVVGIERDPYT
jgi:hypothetical protein